MITGVRLIPLWLLHKRRFPFLKMGIIIDSPQLSGTLSVRQISAKRKLNEDTRPSPPSLNRAGGRLSGPLALKR